MPTAIVLGAGMVGAVMAADLAADPAFHVSIADASDAALARAALRCRHAPNPLRTLRADLSLPHQLTAAILPHDIVLGALPSPLGFAALRTVIDARKNYCDISFMPQDPLALDPLARDRAVTAVVDCGIAPGMSNMIAGALVRRLHRCDHLAIYVGGLPRERRWPFQYKAAFSPADVIEEYTRPARLVEHSRIVSRDALSEPELIDFPGLGHLEAFNTDGLRTLASTLPVPFMKEKTLRYPGHIDLMRALRHIGLFNTDPVPVPPALADSPNPPPCLIRPRDLLSTLMFPQWAYGPGEEDLTVMRIIATGPAHPADSTPTRITYDLFDTFDRPSASTSMSRTTALPATAVARLIANGTIHHPGVHPPETLGQTPTILDKVLADLEARNIRFTQHSEPAP